MKNYLEYKGYIGTVEFSAEDKIFFGKIQGINDVVTFEGTSVTELEKAFQESILDYLETCKVLNKAPDKVFKGSFNVRVSQDLHQKTALLASKKGLNLNDVVKEALSYIIKHEEVLNIH
ncbi:type II toxin-antitoxin system HicB family antitoxin [Flavobacterium sp. ANB]|uniref:type II toxin-antitoxin system HicB family antitoxin n=1 Tax=unclassified Flavobacterium TaxID=196869 RepID=UPI0012B8E74C|nr:MULTISPECIES: type II toxin-antitoxin system HicB family antitoxin [unclassified Flavobacterium]MBF4517721.1 type II toxin-antitoxin system HicB family antitoxin [Flavobacterium sp. ANB]MTD70448.1 toxin-antitoxin system HicB family antitoxin [Flavobacterium sp. LC2016-13]